MKETRSSSPRRRSKPATLPKSRTRSRSAATRYRGNRVSLSPDPGNVDVAETLQRYPEGEAVTVIYNPIDPNECILERDDPRNIRNAWLAVAVLLALTAVGFVAIGQGANRLSGFIARSRR